MKGQITKLILVIAISGLAPLFADLQITNNSNLQLFPKVVKASGGQFVIAWCDNRQSGAHFEIYSNATNSSVSNKVGGSDDDLSTPDPADGHRLHAEIVPSNNGAMVAWVDHKAQKVQALRIDQNGDIDYDFNNSTGNPVDVHPAAFMTPPQMCSDGAGGAIFVWVEKSGSNYILKAKKITSSGGDGWNPATQDIATSAHTIRDPKIVSEGSYAYLMWVEGILSKYTLTSYKKSLLSSTY